LSDTTFETANGISGINQSYQGFVDLPAPMDQQAEDRDLMPLIPLIPNKTDQSKTLLPLVDTTDTTAFNSNEKKSDHIQSTINLTGLSDPSTGEVGSGYDSLTDGDDPHWGAKP